MKRDDNDDLDQITISKRERERQSSEKSFSSAAFLLLYETTMLLMKSVKKREEFLSILYFLSKKKLKIFFSLVGAQCALAVFFLSSIVNTSNVSNCCGISSFFKFQQKKMR
jgi:hypothetical protein